MAFNEKSLENLKFGALARKSTKVKHTYTVLPTTHEWLRSGGNASHRLDEAVQKIIAGELVGIQQVRKLEEEIQRLKALLQP